MTRHVSGLKVLYELVDEITKEYIRKEKVRSLSDEVYNEIVTKCDEAIPFIYKNGKAEISIGRFVYVLTPEKFEDIMQRGDTIKYFKQVLSEIVNEVPPDIIKVLECLPSGNLMKLKIFQNTVLNFLENIQANYKTYKSYVKLESNFSRFALYGSSYPLLNSPDELEKSIRFSEIKDETLTFETPERIDLRMYTLNNSAISNKMNTLPLPNSQHGSLNSSPKTPPSNFFGGMSSSNSNSVTNGIFVNSPTSSIGSRGSIGSIPHNYSNSASPSPPPGRVRVPSFENDNSTRKQSLFKSILLQSIKNARVTVLYIFI